MTTQQIINDFNLSKAKVSINEKPQVLRIERCKEIVKDEAFELPINLPSYQIEKLINK